MSLFHSKIKLFVQGREETFSILKNKIQKGDTFVWVHVASLGEFEQGLPVIERLKKDYPSHKILLTFFSPSGYEVKKNTKAADIIVYLPMDTMGNAKSFIAAVDPVLAIFVKYEIWPNYLRVLGQKQIPTLLISAIFKKDQAYFKWYGGIMRKSLQVFTHFFVQDENSIALLQSIGLKNSTLAGDTRFDRVHEILKNDNKLSFMDEFKGNSTCLVAGSTWPEDEEIIVNFINESTKPIKFILAPHNIKPDHINSLKNSILPKVLLHSEIDDNDIATFEVLIIDTIGLLTKIYSYAEIAYVGGGFATGLHNTLEPAVFGIPILIGPNYDGFIEAENLVDKKGILVIENYDEFKVVLNDLLDNKEFMENIGRINANYVEENQGASIQIMAHIRTLL